MPVVFFLFQDLKEHDFVVTFLKKNPTFFRTLSGVRWFKFGRLIFLLKKSVICSALQIANNLFLRLFSK